MTYAYIQTYIDRSRGSLFDQCGPGGEQSTLVTKGVGGTLGAHTCSERHSWCSCEFLARLQEIAQHRHTLPAWCTGALASPGTRDPCGS